MEAGQPYDLFWQLTMREIALVFDGTSRRLTREFNDRAWLAYHTAVLGRIKKMPKLSALLHDVKPRQRQTPEQMQAIVRSWLHDQKYKRKR